MNIIFTFHTTPRSTLGQARDNRKQVDAIRRMRFTNQWRAAFRVKSFKAAVFKSRCICQLLYWMITCRQSKFTTQLLSESQSSLFSSHQHNPDINLGPDGSHVFTHLLFVHSYCQLLTLFFRVTARLAPAASFHRMQVELVTRMISIFVFVCLLLFVCFLLLLLLFEISTDWQTFFPLRTGRFWLRKEGGSWPQDVDLLWDPGVRGSRNYPQQGPRHLRWLLVPWHSYVWASYWQVQKMTVHVCCLYLSGSLRVSLCYHIAFDCWCLYHPFLAFSNHNVMSAVDCFLHPV